MTHQAFHMAGRDGRTACGLMSRYLTASADPYVVSCRRCRAIIQTVPPPATVKREVAVKLFNALMAATWVLHLPNPTCPCHSCIALAQGVNHGLGCWPEPGGESR